MEKVKTEDEEVYHFIELQRQIFLSFKKHYQNKPIDFPVNALLGFGC